MRDHGARRGWVSCSALVSFAVGAVGAVGLEASPALAATEGCAVFFPDFSCERQARPESSVAPMSFPYLFEDPYITTGLSFFGIWHQFPEDSVFMGGQLGVLALQIRLAITERLALIATKDGIGFLNADNPALRDDTGFLNLGLGFKYAAWQWEDGDQSAIISPSLRYEIPSGNDDVYQGGGDGILIPTVSAAFQSGHWHVVSAIGGNAPINNDKNSSNFFYNMHVDHAFPVRNDVLRFVVPFIELNGIHWTTSGDGSRGANAHGGGVSLGAAAPGFEGVDVANLGNRGVSGSDYITMAWGVRLPLEAGFDIGASYERPVSTRQDITEQRVTLTVAWEF